MISRWTLAIVLASVVSREVWSSLCYSRNCSMTITHSTTENFTCTVGFENEFQNFKKRYGVLEKYDHPSMGLIQERPSLIFLRLHNYSKTPHPEITKYNNKDLELVTHGLELNIRVPEGRENNRALYLELSSKDENGDKDEFYNRFPKKRIFSFSSTQSVIIKNHLCLQDIKPWPVSYTLLLTLYQSHMRPISTEHYISFTKDDIAVAVSKFPKKNDIHIVFYTPKYMCKKNVFLCNDTDYKTCGTYIKKYQGKLEMRSDTNTFFDVLPGIYYIKIEISCPSIDMEDGFVFVQWRSPLIEVPGSTGKDGQISAGDNPETSNTPFIIIGCLIALILLIVMYIAVKKNVSSMFKRRRKKSQAEEINLFNQSSDRPTQSRTSSPESLSETMNQVSEENIHVSLNERLQLTNYDPVPNITDENEDLRRDFCKINRLRRNERICPVHGH
ncbi:uncharacterized protein LOC133195261 [Saccostrea echinata]|uniref:uncharacterized protein LOC133195261 n=1 Tax=Saccostrea echinata TaxID=191078 RepID=UPI002A81AAE1|nr:uncharacterized protein LOC133195261 [Saccostrea echinata]